jgi:Zn-dependent metalloprotease
MKRLFTKTTLLVILFLAFGMVSFQTQALDAPSIFQERLTIKEGTAVAAGEDGELRRLARLMERDIASGNLVAAGVQVEGLGEFVHERFDQYYQGVRVFGAQLIRHSKNGDLYFINGRRYEDIRISAVPGIDAGQAAAAALAHLGDGEYSMLEAPELVVYPTQKDYLLAWMVRHASDDKLMVSFVDAATGRVVFKYNDIQTESNQIGVGRGTFGDTKKLSTVLTNNLYYLVDKMRPSTITTATANFGTSYTSAWYLTDADNNWNHNPTAVDAHAYTGWIYDYFYLVHGWKGMDNNNMETVVVIHYGDKYRNAFYHGGTNWLYFGDGTPGDMYPYAAALDIVAHEFAHGVTNHSSKLIYWGDSGALNEAFSDIMGVSCEFFHQPVGVGYGKADWFMGEDTRRPWGGSMRDLTDPWSQIWYAQYGLRYPDHYSRHYSSTFLGGYDNDGVHINMTIGTHWYYLLANGGTNRVSGITVNGIGVQKAERIAFRAWVHYLFPSAGFWSARSATYQAAVDLFGAGSPEAARVAQAWTAVGVQ